MGSYPMVTGNIEARGTGSPANRGKLAESRRESEATDINPVEIYRIKPQHPARINQKQLKNPIHSQYSGGEEKEHKFNPKNP